AVAPIETGSIGGGAPASGPVAIYLAKGSSLDALRAAWSRIAQQHSSVVENMQPRYRTSGGGDAVMYQLLAGPVETTEQATLVCTALRAAGIGCRVGSFGGEGFSEQ
ncbi:MAG: SPOR domain-containing protein, partial [Hyphomicrobiaceae bacterium]